MVGVDHSVCTKAVLLHLNVYYKFLDNPIYILHGIYQLSDSSLSSMTETFYLEQRTGSL